MIICVCNAIKDGQVTQAVSEGCASVGKIFQNLGCTPNCGKCVPYMKEQFLGDKAQA